MRHVNTTLILIGMLLSGASSQAIASGFMVRENSAESVATVFAGNASRADDLSTVFNNPAGMGQFSGTQLEVGTAAVVPDMHFTGNATILSLPVPGDNSRELGQDALIPHFYGVTDLDARTKLGFAITVPFGNTVDNGSAWSGRYVSIKVSALAVDFNPNISYQLADNFWIGGGVSAQYLKLLLSSGIAQFAILAPTAPDGQFVLNTNSWGFGYNFGFLYEPAAGTKLGLTYRSKVDQSLDGVLKFSAQTSPLLGLKTAADKSPVDLPASVTGSITQQVDDNLSLSSDVQFTTWHVFNQVSAIAPPNPTFTFVEKYRDSWMVSVGGVYKMDDMWSLRGGVGYDESPVTDAYRDTGVPDQNRYMLGIGPSFRLSDTSTLDAAYAYYFGGKATMNKSINAVDPITGVTLHGDYHNALHYLAVTWRVAL
jgi:long-chain fatty acid transport protein